MKDENLVLDLLQMTHNVLSASLLTECLSLAVQGCGGFLPQPHQQGGPKGLADMGCKPSGICNSLLHPTGLRAVQACAHRLSS